MKTLTIGQARRLALRAQGLTAGPRTVARALEKTRLLQLDSVNVVERAHYFPVFSRIGAYDKAALDKLAWPQRRTSSGKRALVEYWAHEAALIPLEDWPAFRWRMDEYRHGRWHVQEELIGRRAALGEKICVLLDERGPSTAGEIERLLGLGSETMKGPWWDRSETKIACEALFAAGVLAVGKRINFNRHYDLVEHVVPQELREVRLTRRESVLRLVRNASSALGVAVEQDLRDYYRLEAKDTKAAIAHLVARGEMEEAQVRGWSQTAYLAPGSVVPRTADAWALVCPFDPLVFFRPRLERLFGFQYRLEIYTPQHKREHGYYVFPFLSGDRLVARVDLKADRKAGALLVLGAFLEDHAEAGAAEPLAQSLVELAAWLGLGEVRAGDKGDLAPALRQIIRAHG